MPDFKLGSFQCFMPRQQLWCCQALPGWKRIRIKVVFISNQVCERVCLWITSSIRADEDKRLNLGACFVSPLSKLWIVNCEVLMKSSGWFYEGVSFTLCPNTSFPPQTSVASLSEVQMKWSSLRQKWTGGTAQGGTAHRVQPNGREQHFRRACIQE